MTTIRLPKRHDAFSDLATITEHANGQAIAGFASLLYRNKFNELALHTVLLGTDYDNILIRSRDELLAIMEIELGFTVITPDAKDEEGRFTLHAGRIIRSDVNACDEYTAAAAPEVLLSLCNSMNSRLPDGTGFNDAYTKAETYRRTGISGIKEHILEGTLELSGMAHAKRVIEAGTYPIVNSRPKTLAKAALSERLSKSRWRTFRIDRAFRIKRMGDTIIIAPTLRDAEEIHSELVTA